ncbi:acyltransferase family protein [Paenibacillus ehimensis]|uniref:acyltransferase family protein n=1 Tax=Paenibacillus ehimensis TaxID=79264 RepID=UPI002DB66C18|nr:acyltransferase family protein [Paenibacillus ehimensis]MEC0212897.1 acyltransferase family protein [Paenibacillus ehimensis]
MQERRKWIDVARGLSIVLVVLGHSGNEVIDHYFGWFRMPLFFLVSGLLFKSVMPDKYVVWALKRIRMFMIPYFAYGICIAVLVAAKLRDPLSVPRDLWNLIYGGTVLGGWYGVFWFITCLLLVHLLMGYLTRYSVKVQAAAVLVSYTAAHLVSMTPLAKVDIPWNADVALMAVTFFFLGYTFKAQLAAWLERGTWFIPALLISAAAIVLNKEQIWIFRMDMKMKVYTQPVLDLIVPLACVLVVLQLCYWASRWPVSSVLAFLGTVTISIMYLHIPVNIVLKYGLGLEYGSLVFTLAGVLIPLGAAWIMSKSPLLTLLFLGQQGFGRKEKIRGKLKAAG